MEMTVTEHNIQIHRYPLRKVGGPQGRISVSLSYSIFLCGSLWPCCLPGAKAHTGSGYTERIGRPGIGPSCYAGGVFT